MSSYASFPPFSLNATITFHFIKNPFDVRKRCIWTVCGKIFSHLECSALSSFLNRPPSLSCSSEIISGTLGKIPWDFIPLGFIFIFYTIWMWYAEDYCLIGLTRLIQKMHILKEPFPFPPQGFKWEKGHGKGNSFHFLYTFFLAEVSWMGNQHQMHAQLYMYIYHIIYKVYKLAILAPLKRFWEALNKTGLIN